MLAFNPFPKLSPFKASDFRYCCGQQPAMDTWQTERGFWVQLKCRNSACENAKGVQASAGSIYETWDAARKLADVC